ncbi:2-keto-4-pentenoate hydratase/2-oxohepta-3-ene-1,7-dioic acid hydratase (catechol pathway) [Streptomyces sp. MnatMP-M27]|uniref:fumarylacetoacetate hydrolase family protein n=1 Tax=Streptomyces sp. MnatMP-M27 TaxID=1839768 RepID=UPI00081D45FA|nr:fumarylacetoacetate hydrolase family protein [Streptomyces sp. MnatMP-M27]SCG01199.1 2-keto-4-pentenoate hydratase/2-oxohepta-3-ene-1,7-dioic acid hydratase (catechol pathway) [Streptomyces sp. MnatMP-M27]
MRWATFQKPGSASPLVGLVRDGTIYALPPTETLIDVIADGADGQAAAAERAIREPFQVAKLDGVRLLAPIPRPPSVRDFMAFENHYVTSMAALGVPTHPLYYQQPVFYFSNPAAIQGPNDDVRIAPGSSDFDYELEVAAVIGRPGSNISPDKAENHIAGYTILSDWSARDVQEAEMSFQIGPAKGKDTATSLGPYLVSKDELAPFAVARGFDLPMSASVNGKQYSSGNWSSIYWSFADLIAYASRGTTLVAGDVIGAGTVGTGCIIELARVHGSERYPYLVEDDVVELTVAQLGSIRAKVTAAEELIPLSRTTRQ